MSAKIHDEFSHLNKHAAYRARHKRDGLCEKCFEKPYREGASLCLKHRKQSNVLAREWAHKVFKHKTRHTNAGSYHYAA